MRRVAEAAARSVGDLLRSGFRSGARTETKRNHHDLVTEYDRASEERLTAALGDAVPDSRFHAEEGGAHGAGRVEWIIDPIDGTSNFAHGVAFFCVSLAAAVDGEVVAGVVYDPVADTLFAAEAAGAFLNGEPLPALDRTIAEKRASVMTDFPSAEDLATDGSAALDGFAELISTYSTVRRPVSGALELAHVAAGWTNIALGFDTNPWDVAAGAYLVRQAGGTYTGYRYDDGPAAAAGAAPRLQRSVHEAPTYVAHGPGVDATTARDVVERLMAQRRAAGHRGKAR
nr:inositol monophosphatase family protein [Zhihengliuella flava]